MKFLLSFLFSLPLWLCAQQPSHYVLGEEELEGVDVYDMLHAADGSYMLATSSGLMQFDGYRFERLDCPDMLLSSVFNLVEDTDGTVYCNNLSGQVFYVARDSCGLLLSLPDSMVSADMSMEMDDRNRLIIASKYLMAASVSGIDRLSEANFFGPLATMPNGSLMTYSSVHRAFLNLKNGQLEEYEHPLSIPTGSEIPGIICQGDRIYVYQTNECLLYTVDGHLLLDPSLVLGKPNLFKLYSSSDGLWFASGSQGVLHADQQLEVGNGGKFLFPRTMISTVLEDREGNILLGTFGKGIMVIPNMNTLDLTMSQLQEDIISVAGSEDGTLYFGTRSGKLLERNPAGSLNVIRDAQVKSMEALFSIAGRYVLIGETNAVLLDRTKVSESTLSVGSLKDIALADTDRVLIASNAGAYWVRIASREVEKITDLQLRHYCIGYDPSTESIYSGTSKGLMIRHPNGAVDTKKLRGKDVIVRDFLSRDGKVFAATAENGLLVFKNDSLEGEWGKSTGLVSDRLTQLAIYKQWLVVATANGIQLLDVDGKVIRTINQADGLNAIKILDMHVNGDELWVVHSSGVQMVMLDAFQAFSYQPTVSLKSVIVNDSLNVSLAQHDFSPEQQQFTFELSTNSLRYRNEISYEYRLEGAETKWRTASYSDNIIEYRSLSSGTYTFRVKAICRDNVSEEVAYTFTIATPFYKAWWFYALVLITVVLLLVLWFRRRLRRRQLLAEQQNELNASKLTAIQSQMNPHFIFNSLNSIQSLVLKGDVDNSYTYITKFANLVRRTLNYSDKEFIDFSEEIKLIELYLTLEQLRFKEDFQFTINTNGIEDVMMPPMLIQPFIENALLHGLLHRNGAKRINLDFELSDVLVCTITDNGVGRAKAKAIKERQRSEHESFSVNAIRTRFEILGRYHKGALGFTYQDLMENGEAMGTRVVLRIPIKRKF
ncbi:MAG: histidine kinase [Flavobacteriales bacterium]|nr:histidine kinase [Flavobacteriales bacterium]